MRLYRLLLRLLPEDFRATYGDEMVRMLAHRLAGTTGRVARASLHIRALVDVVQVSVMERSRTFASRGRSGSFFTDLHLDVRYAVRTLAGAPAFTTGVVLTLGVGIGTVTALFSVVDGVLLQPLPWPHAERLAIVSSPYLNPGNRQEWQASLPLAERSAGYSIDAGTARTPDGAESVRIMPVGDGFLDLLGAEPRAGRGFTSTDHAPDASPVALVREDFWRRWWGDTPPAGASLEIDGRLYDVVGLLPADFYFHLYRGVDVWTPLEAREVRGLSLLLSFPEGTGAEDAHQGLEALAERMGTMATPERRAFVERVRARAVNVHGLREAMLGDVRSSLWLLMGAAAAVLLLAVANVGNLWLGRALGRREELAVRSAMGAGRGRLVRQSAVEALMVALVGASLGYALAALTPALLALAPDYLPRAENVSPGVRAGLFATGAALFAALLFGVAPALAVARRAGLAARSRSGTGGPRTGFAQDIVVVGEVAAALVLVVGTVLLARTYDALRPDDPGFRVDNRMVASFDLPDDRFAEPAATRAFATRLLGEVRSQTGGGDAALATDLPLTGMSMYVTVPSVDGAASGDGQHLGVHFRAVSAGYFDLMEMPLVAGRGFTEADGPEAPGVAVVNEAAARLLWDGRPSPVGRELTTEVTGDVRPLRVVGVVRDAWIIRGPEPRPEVYVSYFQHPLRRFHLVVASTDGSVTAGVLRRAARAADPAVPVRETASLDEMVSGSVVVPRFQASVLGVLTAVALFLAAMGCFAVLSQATRRRRREMGIRVALGSTGGGLFRLVLGRAVRLASMGILLGTAAAWMGTRLLEAHLYGVAPHDPSTFLASAGMIATTVLATALLPAREAARADPAELLREE